MKMLKQNSYEKYMKNEHKNHPRISLLAYIVLQLLEI